MIIPEEPRQKLYFILFRIIQLRQLFSSTLFGYKLLHNSFESWGTRCEGGAGFFFQPVTKKEHVRVQKRGWWIRVMEFFMLLCRGGEV